MVARPINVVLLPRPGTYYFLGPGTDYQCEQCQQKYLLHLEIMIAETFPKNIKVRFLGSIRYQYQ